MAPRVRAALSLLLVAVISFSGVPAAFATDDVVLGTQQVFAPGGASNHRFGQSVAISGETAVIGAPGAATDAGSNRGAAYVYVRTPSGWTHQATLAASDGQSGDYFGNTVAIDGDAIVVGAVYADPRANNSGAAYVFTRAGTVWSQRAKLVPSDSAADDYCGSSLVISGPQVFVGSGRHNGRRGAVWQFTESAGSWTQVYKFTEDVPEGSGFGTSIAYGGSRLLVGAMFEPRPDAPKAGRVYSYRAVGDAWVKGGVLQPSVADTNGYFGSPLAFDGTHAVVGSWNWSGGQGAAYVFRAPALPLSTRWTQTQMLTGDPSEGDNFGLDVAIDGGRMLVSHGGPSKAYLYTLSDDAAWTPEGVIEDLGAASAYALEADTVLCGVPTDATMGGSAGTVHFVTLSAAPEPPGEDPPLFPEGAHRVSGDDRYLTAVDASKRAFVAADTVVVATGANWPDALGGSALAGAVEGPLLLTRPGALPAEVAEEIARLGAKKVYVLGGTAAVADAVEGQLEAVTGVTTVKRLAGAERYATARAIADETIVELVSRGGYSGGALVATGGNFPDATAASPLAASLGWPILLVNPASGGVYVPPSTTTALILGGTGVVPASVQTALEASLGAGNVDRAGGANRYETAAKVADAGVAAGMSWDGVGIATGTDFPDALAGGAMLGAFDSVMLLTQPASLDPYARGRLEANAGAIRALHVVGGTVAISAATMAEARSAAGIP
jgi:putative cell wall-binding protein